VRVRRGKGVVKVKGGVKVIGKVKWRVEVKQNTRQVR